MKNWVKMILFGTLFGLLYIAEMCLGWFGVKGIFALWNKVDE